MLDVIRQRIDSNTIVERRYTGGTCANVLAILAFLGASSAPVGRIGDDETGRELSADLERFGVCTDFLVREPNHRTPVIIQESYTDRHGRRQHRFSWACPTCGARMPSYRPLLLSDVPMLEERLPPHDVFFLDRVTPGTVALAAASRRKGALVVFEPSGIKDERLFTRCLENCHIFKYSDDRLERAEVAGLADAAGVKVQIATLGERGLDFRVAGDKWRHLDAMAAPRFQDAAGAGDWCTAGLVHSLGQLPAPRSLSRETVQAGLRFGQALAALNCAFDGARGMMYALDSGETMEAARTLLANRAPSLPQAPSIEGSAFTAAGVKGAPEGDIHAAHA